MGEMKSIAGAIIVFAGAHLMGLSSDHIPDEPLPTISSIGLMLIGLFVVLTPAKLTSHDRKE